LIVGLVAVALAGASGTPAAGDFVVVAGPHRVQRIGSYHFRSAGYAAAARAFGRPSALVAAGPTCSAHWSRLGLVIAFAATAPEPCSAGALAASGWHGATISAGPWRTDLGLRLGDSVAKLRRLYPKAQAPAWILVSAQGEVGRTVYLAARVRSGRVVGLVLPPGYVSVRRTAGVGAAGSISLRRISTDPFSNSTSQHQTEVEPDSFAAGSTVVMATQAGRFFGGGASDIAFATTVNGGSSWTSGVLPGITVHSASPGTYDRVSDPSVAFDAMHNVWLIASLPLTVSTSSPAVLASRSTDGGLHWSSPVTVATASGSSDFDKTWIVCDNTAASPFYGSCYTQYDDFGANNQVHVAYSRDGGLTWTEGSMPSLSVIGGQPVVQPSGNVIMPVDDGNEAVLLSLSSSDGGVSWTGPVTIAAIASHNEAGGLRSGPLPSAEVDATGKVYVVWGDCRFRQGCKANDIVISTSTDGTTWTAVTRIPIDATSSDVDHFLPGIAVDPSTSGATTKLGLTYYYYPKTNCAAKKCELTVGFVSSLDGGTTWSAPRQLTEPMKLKWLPNTSQGRMVGDYISTSFSGGKALGVFAVADQPTSGSNNCAKATPNCDVATYTTNHGLAAQRSAAGPSAPERPVPNAQSDHPPAPAPLSAR
jgi:hypothetical protein